MNKTIKNYTATVVKKILFVLIWAGVKFLVTNAYFYSTKTLLDYNMTDFYDYKTNLFYFLFIFSRQFSKGVESNQRPPLATIPTYCFRFIFMFYILEYLVFRDQFLFFKVLNFKNENKTSAVAYIKYS